MYIKSERYLVSGKSLNTMGMFVFENYGLFIMSKEMCVIAYKDMLS